MKCIIILLTLLFLGVEQQAFCQPCTVLEYDSIIIKSYFNISINNIKNHLRPTLSAEEISLLSKISFELSGNDDRTSVRSYSGQRKVFIGRTFLIQMARYHVAKILAGDTTFNRKRILGLYNDILFHISADVDPVNFANLTCEQKSRLDAMLRTNEFYGLLLETLSFVVCHEFYHQVKDVDNQRIKLSKIKDPKKRSEVALTIEEEADRYATRKVVDMSLCPSATTDCILMMAAFEDVNNRSYKMSFQRLYDACLYLYKSADCSRLQAGVLCRYQNDDIRLTCSDLANTLAGAKRLYRNASAMERLTKSVVDTSTAYSAYNMGDFYVKGTDVFISDYSLAILHYKFLSKLDTSGKQLYGASNLQSLISMVEYSRIVLGLIYQYHQKKFDQAYLYYVSASELGTFLSKDYYDILIKNSYNK